MISQGEIWWADMATPIGSEPGYRRPVVSTNASRVNYPGIVFLSARTTRLPKDSVVNMAHVVTLDRRSLTDRIGNISRADLSLMFVALDVVLGR